MSSAQRYSQDLHDSLTRLRAGKLRVHIPQRRELHRKRPRSHFHATPELFIQTGGATDFDCAGQTFQLNTGDICVMPRGVPHAESPRNKKTPYGIIVFMNAHDGVYLLRARSDISDQITGYDRFHLQGGRGHDIFRYLDDVSDLESLSRKHRKAYCHAVLEAFLLAVCSELSQPPQPDTEPHSLLVSEAEKFARMHLSESTLTVAGIAQALNCTADHLSRMFHRQRGLTLTTWIAQERIAQARTLLEEATYNISEVGWACGFNEPSYFIRTFKRHMGMTPRQYRLTVART